MNHELVKEPESTVIESYGKRYLVEEGLRWKEMKDELPTCEMQEKLNEHLEKLNN